MGDPGQAHVTWLGGGMVPGGPGEVNPHLLLGEMEDRNSLNCVTNVRDNVPRAL